MAKKKRKLKVIPLGGLGEIGKNITVFEYGDDIFVVDCGIAFPEDDMLGIDLVIPDISYLTKNREKVRGIVLTHGHEDHIGALPYVLKDLNVPVYGTKLTLGLLEQKLEEHGLLNNVVLNVVKHSDVIELGCFKVEFIRSTHSIADSTALAIFTPVGTIFHTGDFKIDYTPIEGEPIDLARLAELGKKGVLLLMCDSTNVEREGYTMSEKTVGETFDEIFMNAKNRILVATFASNVHRIQQIVNAAIKFGRKIAICGRSMVNVVNVAMELGYMNVPEGLIIDIDHINKYPPEKIVIITTGSQGEPMSALTRMASGDHKKVEIIPGDLVIISANPIPGNEKLVSRVVNDLFKKGAEVIYESLADIHVSGHASQEELKLIHRLIRPKYFMPVHGEYRHLKRHANLAVELGMSPENIFIMDIGKVLELTNDSAKINGSVNAGRVLVDGLGVGDVGNIVLRDRKHLSQDGLIVVVITIEGDTGNVIAGPDVISRGFVYVRESEDLMEEIREVCKAALQKCNDKKKNDWSTKKSIIRDALRDFLYERTKRRPMILPIIMEV
ncbi:MAG TPA: ribonuclease J [Hungateiclostridium thermocellum]|uniref:Ribonuclease J n=2 Tax=Acetivibrio thermocellus TaxID=1515 RepID=A3DF05_ACET2|nr:ribonuclease J [Acetivibrio thermocellus]CDG35973.1 Ribonuclease J 1 [Acetivibrio thermocellus BC1]ABN52534.1 RNA-metabolising metallo-beta-lactamase [Acetivibrio thermocellus ATCC 27405]ADU74023.1 RNA-metabolising metallo-beta-lactamase [Acetivibrio thermocellus DSM 1313]ALX07961.1 Ribocuclease J [Acetivibrio thermocellus AD2]ANV75707.1 Ribocuclease J [Acetivibrio thermocellus DSM 2360]